MMFTRLFFSFFADRTILSVPGIILNIGNSMVKETPTSSPPEAYSPDKTS